MSFIRIRTHQIQSTTKIITYFSDILSLSKKVVHYQKLLRMFSKHFTTKFLSKHYSLVPLFGAVGFGITLSGLYTLRLAVQNPDVSWRRTANPEPWQHRVSVYFILSVRTKSRYCSWLKV